MSSGSNSDWLKQTNFGVLNLTASTTIPYWAKDAIYASSTLQVQGLTTLVNATTSLLTVSNGAWFTNGNIGISTTSPWGLLSINPNGISGPSFVVGSSTATNFVITNSGNVGIGTTSPGSLFSLNNIANFTTATSSFYGNGLNLANGCFAINGTCVGAGGGSGTINSGTTGQLSYYAGNGTTLTATSSLFIHSNQNIGIGTTTPNWLLQAAGTRPFFTLSDTGAAANNKHWFLSSQGGNFYVGTSSDAYATTSISALTITNGGNVGIATSNPYGSLDINATSGSNPILYLSDEDVVHGMTDLAPTNVFGKFTNQNSVAGMLEITGFSDNSTTDALTLRGFLGNNDPADSAVAVSVLGGKKNGTGAVTLGSLETVFNIINYSIKLVTILGNGNFGIGTTSPYAKLSVVGETTSTYFSATSTTATSTFLGAVGVGTSTPAEQLSVSGQLFVGGTGTSTIQNNLYVMGTLRSTVSYVGDLIFSNNFKFIETPRDAKIQSLFLQNQYGENIFKIDEKGELIVKKIKAEEGDFKQGNFEEKLKTKELQIGSPQNRTGITIYDKKTGQPYCLEINDGKIINKEGECK